MYTLYCNIHWDVHIDFFFKLENFILNIEKHSTLFVLTLEAKEQHRKKYKTCILIKHLFKNIIDSLFVVRFQRSKMLWMHQIKIYINYLNFKGKKTQNKHKKR
jgi:hypothetical protein